MAFARFLPISRFQVNSHASHRESCIESCINRGASALAESGRLSPFCGKWQFYFSFEIVCPSVRADAGVAIDSEPEMSDHSVDPDRLYRRTCVTWPSPRPT